MRRPKARFSKIDFGNGFGFWNTIDSRMRISVGSACAPTRSMPSGSSTICPS